MCCAYGPGDDLSCATEKIITELLALAVSYYDLWHLGCATYVYA